MPKFLLKNTSKKNKIKIGLKTIKKLDNSFYRFIVIKHIDWAIILAVFFACIPYLRSENYYIYIIKTIIFSIIIYFSIRYFVVWKDITEYLKKRNKLISIIKRNMKANKFDTINKQEIDNFFLDTKNATQELVTKIKSMTTEEKQNYKSFQDYINKNPNFINPIIEIFNRNLSITKSTIYLSLGFFTLINEIRKLPQIEKKNYNRIKYIVLLMIMFFIVYSIEYFL